MYCDWSSRRVSFFPYVEKPVGECIYHPKKDDFLRDDNRGLVSVLKPTVVMIRPTPAMLHEQFSNLPISSIKFYANSTEPFWVGVFRMIPGSNGLAGSTQFQLLHRTSLLKLPRTTDFSKIIQVRLSLSLLFRKSTIPIVLVCFFG